MKSKKEIKALMNWHQQDAAHIGGAYYADTEKDPASPKGTFRASMLGGGLGVDVAKLAAEPRPRARADCSIVKSFTSCDGTWIKNQVKNRRLDKQAINVTEKRLSLLPEVVPQEEDLLDDLKGYNGAWRQRKAEVTWPFHVARKESEAIREAEREERKKQSKLKKEQREMENIAKAKHARHLKEERERLVREQRARRLAMEEEERRKKQAEEEERQRRQNDKKPCGKCKTTGICVGCEGKGFFVYMFLSPSVTAQSAEFRGRTAKGCEECGGCSEYSASGKLRRGNGKCSNCKGTGMVDPDHQDHKTGPTLQAPKFGMFDRHRKTNLHS